jgi:phosphatidylserine/phosphatidylglycerophosphate/cardiolipin synthase-like enzyme
MSIFCRVGVKASRLFIISSLATVLAVISLGVNPASASGTHPANITLLKNREYPDALLTSIRQARKSVLLAYYLFKTTPSSTPDQPGRIAEELAKVRHRGVAVTVILEVSDDPDDPLNSVNRKTGAFLEARDIRVLFDSPRTKTHLKVALIDGRYVFLGSHNLTQSALKYNNEVSVLVDSPEVAAEMNSYLDSLGACPR